MTMIERVARAMFDASRKDAALRGVQTSWDMYPFKDAMLDMASAAIEAMREPTEIMYRAAYKEQDDSAIHNYGASPAFDDYWSVAIDAALNEQVSG